MTRLRTERGLDRLVNFSDATVAIAITVLLLPLVDIALEIEKLSLGDLFARNLGTIIAFAITFAVNGITTMLASQRKLTQIMPLS